MRIEGNGTRLVGGLAAASLVAALAASGAASGPPNGKGGGEYQDLSVCTSLSPVGGLASDVWGVYCDSESGVDARVGRNRGILVGVAEKRNHRGRHFALSLGERLPDVAGDPDPNADGGVIDQPTPGDWSTHALPEIPPELIGNLMCAYRVNVLRMGEPNEEPNPNLRNGRLRWTDADGHYWELLWGPHLQPGEFQKTNPDAPAVMITRRDDGAGNLLHEWDVVTLGDGDAARAGASTAFLWRRASRNGPFDYFGAFDVSFEYSAVEEP